MSLDARARRLNRLREELEDEGVPLDLNVDGKMALLEEIDYARRPQTHEGLSPRFGAIVVKRPIGNGLSLDGIVDVTDIDPAVVRRLADGRTSFFGRFTDGHALISLENTIEHEATAVQAAVEAELTVVQRQPTGWVRVFDPRGVITWDGSRWWAKPLARDLTDAIRRQLGPLPGVLDCLAELCVHWLSPNRVGAVLAWQIEPDAELHPHVGMSARVEVLPIDLTQRLHFAAALNLLAQTDRAALVHPSGLIDTVGVALRPSPSAVAKVTPYKGTRHTSALRFSYDVPHTIVFVVSSSGPVTVMHAGHIVSIASPTPPAENGVG